MATVRLRCLFYCILLGQWWAWELKCCHVNATVAFTVTFLGFRRHLYSKRLTSQLQYTVRAIEGYRPCSGAQEQQPGRSDVWTSILQITWLVPWPGYSWPHLLCTWASLMVCWNGMQWLTLNFDQQTSLNMRGNHLFALNVYMYILY